MERIIEVDISIQSTAITRSSTLPSPLTASNQMWVHRCNITNVTGPPFLLISSCKGTNSILAWSVGRLAVSNSLKTVADWQDISLGHLPSKLSKPQLTHWDRLNKYWNSLPHIWNAANLRTVPSRKGSLTYRAIWFAPLRAVKPPTTIRSGSNLQSRPQIRLAYQSDNLSWQWRKERNIFQTTQYRTDVQTSCLILQLQLSIKACRCHLLFANKTQLQKFNPWNKHKTYFLEKRKIKKIYHLT